MRHLFVDIFDFLMFYKAWGVGLCLMGECEEQESAFFPGTSLSHSRMGGPHRESKIALEIPHERHCGVVVESPTVGAEVHQAQILQPLHRCWSRRGL